MAEGIVVVGVDNTGRAQRAAEVAAQVARALGHVLHIVTAYQQDRIDVYGSGSDQLIVSEAADAESVARRVSEKLGDEHQEVKYFSVRGTPAKALITHAEMHGASLIVVGNKGVQGIGRVLGSIASSVAHSAPCDVYIVKTNETAVEPQ
ncbi:universal stress protein [Kocuria kalidii]|uniref:universal stress protein n=1 Tax=Kocuria kalidii TaxID=3376283 RepID=UPI0037972859